MKYKAIQSSEEVHKNSIHCSQTVLNTTDHLIWFTLSKISSKPSHSFPQRQLPSTKSHTDHILKTHIPNVKLNMISMFKQFEATKTKTKIIRPRIKQPIKNIVAGNRKHPGYIKTSSWTIYEHYMKFRIPCPRQAKGGGEGSPRVQYQQPWLQIQQYPCSKSW